MLYQVEVGNIYGCIKQLIGELLDSELHLLDPGRREDLMDQDAKAGVIRHIPSEHVVVHHAEQAGPPAAFGQSAGRPRILDVFDEALIFHHRSHILISSDDPERIVDWPVHCHTEDGRLGPQPGIKRERIGFELRACHIDGLKGDALLHERFLPAISK